MLKEDAVREAAALVEESGFAMLSTNGDSGYPNIKAMIKFENEGLKKIWFSTNTSSRRVEQILKDGKTCVYFSDYGYCLSEMRLYFRTESRKNVSGAKAVRSIIRWESTTRIIP